MFEYAIGVVDPYAQGLSQGFLTARSTSPCIAEDVYRCPPYGPVSAGSALVSLQRCTRGSPCFKFKIDDNQAFRPSSGDSSASTREGPQHMRSCCDVFLLVAGGCRGNLHCFTDQVIFVHLSDYG